MGDQPMSCEKYDNLVEILSGLQGLNQADVHTTKRQDLWGEVLSERKRLNLETNSKQEWFYKVGDGASQGPFSQMSMLSWQKQGYFEDPNIRFSTD